LLGDLGFRGSLLLLLLLFLSKGNCLLFLFLGDFLLGKSLFFLLFLGSFLGGLGFGLLLCFLFSGGLYLSSGFGLGSELLFSFSSKRGFLLCKHLLLLLLVCIFLSLELLLLESDFL
jgi:hypothetical protein